jgi:hypothetical protein
MTVPDSTGAAGVVDAGGNGLALKRMNNLMAKLALITPRRAAN